ncbi:hypothetical protein BGW41_003240 [Actinomortierella wolfii]|nr:hypothetical protein BGW41_003240 [Actinomortierella wolfii]
MEFRVTDWVTEDKNEIDMCLFSLTKWIHLHHGDDGIKRFFHKVYRSLAPGGIFLLEPQKFATYTKRAKLMPEMHKTCLSIQFKPEQFEQYLLEEVGFQRVVPLRFKPNLKPLTVQS